MKTMAGLVLVLAGAAAVLGQVTPTTTAPATAPSTMPKNIDKALEEEIASFEIKNGRLEDAIVLLRESTHTNIAVNWTALGAAGVTRDTPVTLRLNKLPYEEVLRSLMDVIPASKTRPNYIVGGNTVEIATTADFGKAAAPKIYDLSRATSASLDGGKPTADQRAKRAEFICSVVRKELQNAGEEAPGRTLGSRGESLAAVQSKRGQLFVLWTIGLFETPTRLHQAPQGTGLTAQAKKTHDRLNELKLPLTTLAADAEKSAPDLNVILLPGTQAELAKENPKLDYLVTDGGVVEIGPAAEFAGRVNLGVYDLRELLKKMAIKSKVKPAPDAAELAAAVMAVLKEKVPPYRDEATGSWGEMEKSASSMTLYEGFLVVFAQPRVHRMIVAGLEDMNRN